MTTSLPNTDVQCLYEQDFNLWITTTAQQIRARNFKEEARRMDEGDRKALISILNA